MFHVEHIYNTHILKSKFICKDYTVSGELFELIYDSELDLYYTHPQPKEGVLAGYYKSEDYISHTDRNTSLFDRVYQIVKNYSIYKKVNLIDSLNTKGKKLLDIGCGTGSFLAVAEKRNWRVFGVEPNEKARQLAKKKLNKSKGILSAIDKIETEEKFDIISMWHVLEHIPNYDSYISYLKLFLKKEGYLLVAVPNFKSFDANYYQEFWAAYDVPRHLWHFSQKAIEKIFRKHNMKIKQIIPLRFDSFYVSLLSEKNKSGKFNIISAFKIGFMSNRKAKKTKEYSSLIYIIKRE